LIHAIGCCAVGGRIRFIDGNKLASIEQEAMSNGGLVCVPVAHDLASRTDSGGKCVQSTGIIQMSEGAVLVHEPVGGERVVYPCSNDHARIVDGVELRANGSGKRNIHGGEDVIFQQKTVLVSVVVKISADNIAPIVDSPGKAELRAECARRVEGDVVL